MAATTKSKAEKEREKVQLDKCQAILSGMLKDEDNKYCVDCDSKGPRWASWNLGMFLCIRCAGIHRNLGVHISKVKSVNLDSWTPQQVASMQNMGNSKGRAVYEANLPDDFRRPTNDSAMEAFIRNKYEKKKFIAKEWVATKPPDLPLGWHDVTDQDKPGKGKDVKKMAVPAGQAAPSTLQPAAGSVKRADAQPVSSPDPRARATATVTSSTTSDLLGLAVGQQQQQQPLVDDDLLGFSAFVSASPSLSSNAELLNQNSAGENNNLSDADFFNQVSSSGTSTAANGPTTDSSKMSKDSILALFGSRPPTSPASSSPAMFGAPTTFGHPSVPGLGAVPNNSNQAALLGLNGGFSTSYSPLQQQQTMFPIRPPGIAGATGYPQLYPSLQQQPPPVNPLLANNPFMEPTAAAPPQLPKMISTLPQNVFQINNQLSGLSLNPSPASQSVAPSLWQ